MTLTERARRLNWASGRDDLPYAILMTDEARLPDPSEAVRHLPSGCAVLVRHSDARARRDLAVKLAPIARARGLMLFISDDPSLAREVGADGLHVPERRAAGADALILRRSWRGLLTCAAHSPRAIQRADMIGADAVLVSPVFTTPSHPDRASIGALRFSAWCKTSRVPVYALGGLSEANGGRLRGSMLVGIAGIGGLTSSRGH